MPSQFFSALRTVATSPYALIGYVCLIGTYLLIGIKNTRLAQIAKVISKVPPQDRAALLAREYSTFPRSGVSAEQWIRARKHTLITIAFVVCIIALLIIAVTAIVTYKAHPSPEIQTSRNRPPVEKPAPRIITAAPYGNLSERCESMGNAIQAYVESRLKEPVVTDREAYNQWYRLNDGQFRFHFWKDVTDLQKDLSAVRVVDPRLDELLEKGQRYFDYRQQHIDVAMKAPEMCHLSIRDIGQVAARFKYIATEIPPH